MSPLLAALVLAYSSPGRYAQDPIDGGSGGRFFTGSPSDGFTCEVCHASGAPGPEVILNGFPKDGYEPGRTYAVSFEWTAHDYGTTTEVVTIVAELQTDDGEPAGALELPPIEDAAPDSLCVTGGAAAELFELADGRTVLTLNPCGATKLRARWTAPSPEADACAPDAVVFAAAMQGDESEDPDGDGLTLRTRRIAAQDDACLEASEPSGCRVGGRSFAPLLLLFAAWRRRRVG